MLRELIKAAEEKTNGRPDNELQDKFSELPDDEEELHQEMLRLRAEADGIACSNPHVVSRLKSRIVCQVQFNPDVLLYDTSIIIVQGLSIVQVHTQTHTDLMQNLL